MILCRIIFHFFCFYYAEVRRKLWLKASEKRVPWARCQKNFQVYFIRIDFFNKPNKKNLQ